MGWLQSDCGRKCEYVISHSAVADLHLAESDTPVATEWLLKLGIAKGYELYYCGSGELMATPSKAYVFYSYESAVEMAKQMRSYGIAKAMVIPKSCCI